MNESFSDVFGSIVKQRALGQTVDRADWLIGAGILGTAFTDNKTALRSMKAPGRASHLDRQPGEQHGDRRRWPTRAFYRVAIALGGHSWERAGRIWFRALTQGLKSDSDFHAAAEANRQRGRRIVPSARKSSTGPASTVPPNPTVGLGFKMS